MAYWKAKFDGHLSHLKKTGHASALTGFFSSWETKILKLGQT